MLIALCMDSSDDSLELASMTETMEYTLRRLSLGSSLTAMSPSSTILSRWTESVDCALPMERDRSVSVISPLCNSASMLLRISPEICTRPFLV